MRASVVIENRFARTPRGEVWTPNQFPYAFWEHYLSVFEGVNVVARVAEIPEPPEGWVRVDGPKVGVSPVPYYRGPLAYLRRRGAVARACKEALAPRDAVSLRLGSVLASHVSHGLRHSGRPYGVDVVSDPFDAFAPGSIDHPLRPALRWYFLWQTRSICSAASTGCYVTKRFLQQRYPVKKEAPVFSASDVMLPKAVLRERPRAFEGRSGSWHLLFVGSLEQRYKGLHILLEAMSTAIHLGADLRLTVLGGGKEQPALERQTQRLELGRCVRFRGARPREAVFEELERADIFVLPSLTEGMPRALLEAMARGLPCIASDAGGIPEVLPEEEVVRKGDVQGLAAKLSAFTSRPDLLSRLSRRNIERTRHFVEEVIVEKRKCFWACLRDQTEHWLRKR